MFLFDTKYYISGELTMASVKVALPALGLPVQYHSIIA
jgi:hypothetical protein